MTDSYLNSYFESMVMIRSISAIGEVVQTAGVEVINGANAWGLLKGEISDGGRLTPKIKVDNSIIHILEDQHSHSVSEIASSTNIPAEKVELFLRFLAKYSFITYDEQRETAVICADFLSLK